jgi:LPXTG-motif cell wall-anchored protein
MTVNATKVVESPTVVVAQKAKLTGEMPPPPPPPPADVPILVVEEVAVPVQVAQAAPQLPKTGSTLPLIGLLGLLSLVSSFGLRTARKSQ